MRTHGAARKANNRHLRARASRARRKVADALARSREDPRAANLVISSSRLIGASITPIIVSCAREIS